MTQQEAARRYYLKNKQKYRERNILAVKRKNEYIKKKREVPCMDCGIQYPHYVMEFDHREDKLFSVNANYGWAAIDKELEKCDVVCSNCHSIRTYLRRTDGIGIHTKLRP